MKGERREEAGQGQALEQSSAMTSNPQTVIKTKDFQKALAHTKGSIFWLSRGCVEVFNCFRLIEYLLFFQSSDKGGFFLLSELQNFKSIDRKNRIKLPPTKLLNNLITDWYFVLLTVQT